MTDQPEQPPRQPYPYQPPSGPQPPPYGQQGYPPPGYGQQPYGQPYPPQRTVSKTGITKTAHTVHLILTICTCGVWGIVWFLHWLFTRSKTTTRPY